MAPKTLFAWRKAVLSANGPQNPTTRLVLIALSQHINTKSGDCFPTTSTLATETGLSKKTVVDHLALAEQGGWITRERIHADGRGWRKMSYSLILGGGVVDSPPQRRGVRATPPQAERGVAASPPQADDVVKEVHHNLLTSLTPSPPISPPPKSKPEEKPKLNGYSPAFEAAWEAYPKRLGGNSKPNAFKAWKAQVKKGVDEQDLIDGVRRYARFCTEMRKVGTSYVKMAATFFGPGEHWKEEWGWRSDDGPPDLMAL